MSKNQEALDFKIAQELSDKNIGADLIKAERRQYDEGFVARYMLARKMETIIKGKINALKEITPDKLERCQGEISGFEQALLAIKNTEQTP